MTHQQNSATPLLIDMGKRYNIANFNDVVDPDLVATVLIQTCFKQQVSFAQMTALLIVAKQYNLNPFTREIYAYPDRNGGIVPIVGVDGWCNMVNSHSEFSGMEFRYSDELEPLIDKETVKAHAWVECFLYRKDRERPVVVREYLSETYKTAPIKHGQRKDGAWQSHPNRMLRHKALIQCARYAFGFTGVYDPDEASQMIRDIDAIVGESTEQQAQQAQQAQQGTIKDVQQDAQVAPVENYAESTTQKSEEEQPVDNGKPPMSDERFLKNFNKSRKLFADKVVTAQEVIDKIETTYCLTPEQKQSFIQLELEAAQQ